MRWIHPSGSCARTDAGSGVTVEKSELFRLQTHSEENRSCVVRSLLSISPWL